MIYEVKSIKKKALPWSENGMTMVELMAAMCIFSVIILALCQLYSFAYNNWTDGNIEEQLQQKMQSAMGYIEKDIKQAKYNPTLRKTIDVIHSGSEALIYEDVDNDGKLEEIHYRLTPECKLQRNVVTQKDDGSETYPDPDPTKWMTLLENVIGGTPSTPLFVMDPTTSEHPNLSIGVTMTVRNPVRPTANLILNAMFAVRGNVELQGGK